MSNAIIQGQNSSIQFNVKDITSLENVTSLEISLYSFKELKHWTKEDVTIKNNVITAPLTQAETVEFPSGDCTVEIKWVTSRNVIFAKKLPLKIDKRFDKTIMELA